jgi:hypothetical protein
MGLFFREIPHIQMAFLKLQKTNFRIIMGVGIRNPCTEFFKILNTVGYAITIDATMNKCYNKQFLIN